VRLCVTSLTSIYLAMYFELDEPHWAGWTVFSVSLATRASSIQKSTWRAFCTILGAAVGIVLMDNFARSTLAYDVALALWLGIMTYCLPPLSYAVPAGLPGSAIPTLIERTGRCRLQSRAMGRRAGRCRRRGGPSRKRGGSRARRSQPCRGVVAVPPGVFRGMGRADDLQHRLGVGTHRGAGGTDTGDLQKPRR
jgi:hypothetical protein